jgi:hypothetical protein
VVTTNQRRAATLAEQITRGALSPRALTDNDWSLLLLAAGTNAVAAPPTLVVRRVLERAERGTDYFRRGAQLVPPSHAERGQPDRSRAWEVPVNLSAVAQRFCLWIKRMPRTDANPL